MKKILWRPTRELLKNSQMAKFKSKINSKYKIELENYNHLHKWACENPTHFWKEFYNDCNLISSNTYSSVISGTKMPGIKWFTGEKLNYAENCLRYNDDHTAIINTNESGEINRTSYKKLTDKVSIIQLFWENMN